MAPSLLASPERHAPEQLLRPIEAARLLSVSRQELYKLMSRGAVPWVELPLRGRRIAASVIRQLIEQGRRGGWAAPWNYGRQKLDHNQRSPTGPGGGGAIRQPGDDHADLRV
jgi:hypothetical protein